MKVLLLIFCFPALVQATKPELPATVKLQKIFAKYWSSDSVFMQIDKKSIMGLLGKTTEASGRLLFVKGKLRIDFLEPEATTIIFDEKNITLLKNIKQGLKDRRLVSVINKSKAESQNALMGLLFGDKKVWDKLKLIESTQKGDLISLHFNPKKSEDIPGVVKVAIVFDADTNEIRAIKQWDDSENEVQFMFSSMLFDIPFQNDYFTYKPKPSDEVTKL